MARARLDDKPEGSIPLGSKNNPSTYDCYANSDPNEPMFVLLGRDRHGSALVRLWALMREKEGEKPEIIKEARDVADSMEAEARKRGKPVMTMESVVAFAVTLQEARAAAATQPQQPEQKAVNAPIEEGDIVAAGHGEPGRVEKLFGKDDPERVRGLANIRYSRDLLTTLPVASLRRAQPEEVEKFKRQGI